ncbi:helix-turn-helix domain-containing protein [Streptomyces virginiae]|uniref:helix-turn-helix domain-containing protein n=1 Tax=Streptomyces virginiae TaxID=1961 RepID=UPI0022507C8C|nr:helix-turn-helix domain-containing protein [Streptomyces virginiae]MCX4956917.1 helix-turn-helix domain-containing protein [Streptomyces virginiae]MCX5175663.1 helix-turn-helix domain-containing protein [Streptomyces virginiae]
MARSGTEGRGVLEGAFALMEVLAEGEEVGLTRLAGDAELPKATAHRLLGQLVALGAVQSRSGRYRLGARAFRLGQAWHPARALRAASARPLRELASANGRLSLSLSVAEAGQTIVVAGLRGEVDDVFPLRSGVVLPPGSAAELILAASAPAGDPPEGRTAAAWAREVAQARERGLAFEYGRCVSTLSCVSAPILSASGQVVAAVAATALDPRQIAPLGESVARAAAMISANLSRRPATAARPHRERPARPPGPRAPHPVLAGPHP